MEMPSTYYFAARLQGKLVARVAKYLFRVARRPGAGLTHSLLFEAQTPQVSLPRAARRPPRVFRFLWGVEVTEEIGMRIALGNGGGHRVGRGTPPPGGAARGST